MATIYDLKYRREIAALIALLEGLDRAAVACSGGTDSVFLLKAAADVLGENCMALTAVSPVFPQEDFRCPPGIPHHFLPVDLLALEGFRTNPPDRCYHCKKHLFRQIRDFAAAKGFSTLLEGSNLDDLGDYRPGLRALAELGVGSPLRESGMTKAMVRSAARALGLDVWDKPSAACLASRVPYGEEITAEKLARIGAGEAWLHSQGFPACRVRAHGPLARIEVPAPDLPRLLERGQETVQALRALGFTWVTMDLGGLRTGSMNEMLGEEARDGTA